MTGWTRKRTTNVAIRAAGALCCTASYLAVGGLAHLRAAPAAQPGVLAYALAASAFLGASIGAVLIVLGRHIFDQIQVSGRWQRRSASSWPQPQGRGGAGTDAFFAPRARATSTDLPLPWRAPDLAASRSTALRTARQS